MRTDMEEILTVVKDTNKRVVNVEKLLYALADSKNIKVPGLSRSKTAPSLSDQDLLPSFDLSLMKKNKRKSVSVAIYGKKGMGKTTCISNIMSCSDIKNGLYLTTDPNTVSKIPIHNEYDAKKIETVLDDEYEKMKWLVVDNMVISSEEYLIHYQDIFNEEPYVFTIFVVQQMSAIRILPDYIFIFNSVFANVKRKIHELYVKHIVPDFNVFDELLKKYTKNIGECIVIDYNNKQMYKYVTNIPNTESLDTSHHS